MIVLNHLKGKRVNKKKTITLYIQKYKKIIKVKKRNHLKQALELCTVGKALGYFTVCIVQTRHAIFPFLF